MLHSGYTPKPCDESDPDPVVILGYDAWQRRKGDVRASWEDWKAVGRALLVGHEQAKRLAGGVATGHQYSTKFHGWLGHNGFADMAKDYRSKLIWLMNRIDEVEEWRAKRTQEERAEWNHPFTLYRVCHCHDRGLAEFLVVKQPTKNNGSEPITPHVDGDGEPADAKHQKLIVWQKGLLVRANKAIDAADLTGLWAEDAPPDPTLIDAVGKAAAAWAETLEYLKSIANATPEELAEARESYARTKEATKQYAENKEAKRQAKEEAAVSP